MSTKKENAPEYIPKYYSILIIKLQFLKAVTTFYCTECDDGTYGYNCVHKCSGHCLNDSSCNKKTGHCDMGCKLGYTYSNCSKGTVTYKCIYMLL